MQNHNPAGTKGFAFLEFTTLEPETLQKQFLAMGFLPIAKHKNKDITIYQQNDIRFILNVDAKSVATQFAAQHGPSVSAMGFHVVNAESAYQYTLTQGARACEEGAYKAPAIHGVGGSLIYFVDDHAHYAHEFNFLPQTAVTTPAIGLTYIDHVTHNLHRGNMQVWAEFYENMFNFKEIRYFDIEGKLTGLKSRAMTSPCTNIRIPLNESSDDKSQIEEFLKDFNGEGIQHIALGTNDIYQTVEGLREKQIGFLATPDTYYELIDKRLPEHGEDIKHLQKNKILIDGSTKEGPKLLLQIFTTNMLGPVFFEIIQRKGDEGFGEGNFRALFESIELDQIKRGVLKEGS